MLRFERKYFNISFAIVTNINLLRVIPKKNLLFQHSKNHLNYLVVSISSPFSSIARRMEWISKVREHENYCSLEMGQLDLLLTLVV